MGELLITGASGFIGGRLLRRIGADPGFRGRNPIVIASRPVGGFRWVNRQGSDLHTQLTEILDGAGIDALLHLGAHTPKVSTEANHIADCNGNIAETSRILDALPSLPRRIVFASTLDVYRFDENVISEDTIPDPPTLYGASKLYCERMLSHWCSARNVGLQILRIGHVYGPGEESYRKLIPVTIARCLDGLNPRLQTRGSEVRSFIHVDDICRMILESALAEQTSEPVLNLVSSTSIPVREVIEMVIRLTGASLTIEQAGQSPGQSTLFDNRRMIARFGPEQISLEDGLAEEVEYLREVRSSR